MNEFLADARQIQVLGLPLGNLLFAILTTLVAYLAMAALLRIAKSRLRKLSLRTAIRADDMLAEVLGATHQVVLGLAALLFGLGMLEISEKWAGRLSDVWFLALAVQIGLWLTRAIAIGMRRYNERACGGASVQVSASTTLLSWALRTVLWAVVALSILSNMGVNITAFVASLGVGGIAIALAVQNILGDLFASLSIAVDKPFEVGDFIGVNSMSGTVQHIGLKTTRIRSLGGEQIVISNTDLLKHVVKNFKRMEERRIVFAFGLTFDATPEQAGAAATIVQRVIEGREKLRFDRAHFHAFGASSLDYEVVYIVKDPSYNTYMDEQQCINLALMREFAAIGVSFAFPTRTVHIAPAAPTSPAAFPTFEPACVGAFPDAAPSQRC